MKTVGGVGLKGKIKEWKVKNRDGSISQQGCQPNLILDQGIDNAVNNNKAIVQMFEHCAVGTGNTTPSTSQTGLDNEVNRRSYDGGSTDVPSVGQTPHTFVYTRRFDYPEGSLNDDLEEVGFSDESTSGNNLFSRALFKDSSGNPTVVSVNTDQSLEITYEVSLTLNPGTKTSTSFVLNNYPGDDTFTYDHKIQHTRRQTGQVCRAVGIVAAGGASNYGTESNPQTWNSGWSQLEPGHPSPRLFLANGNQSSGTIATLMFGEVGEGPYLSGADPGSWLEGQSQTLDSVSYNSSNKNLTRYFVMDVNTNFEVTYIGSGSNFESDTKETPWFADLSHSGSIEKSNQYEITFAHVIDISTN